MKIILNEKGMLDKSLNNGYIDSKPSITIRLLAKHFFGIGQNKNQVFDSIDNFMIKNCRNYNITNWQDTINRIVNKVSKLESFEFLNIDKIIIYKEELEVIKNINNLRLEKLAFVLLVYSKIYNKMNKNETNWVNSDLKNIYSDTKMAISKKDQDLMVNKLVNMGLLEVSRIVNCTNIKILFTKNNGEITIEIDDFRDFVYYYLKWKGFKIGVCEGEDCGRLIKIKNNKNKYCPDCWKIIRREQIKDNVANFRLKNKM